MVVSITWWGCQVEADRCLLDSWVGSEGNLLVDGVRSVISGHTCWPMRSRSNLMVLQWTNAIFRLCSSHVRLESILSMDQRVHQVTLDVSFKNGQGYLVHCGMVTEISIVQLWFCVFNLMGSSTWRGSLVSLPWSLFSSCRRQSVESGRLWTWWYMDKHDFYRGWDNQDATTRSDVWSSCYQLVHLILDGDLKAMSRVHRTDGTTWYFRSESYSWEYTKVMVWWESCLCYWCCIVLWGIDVILPTI